MNEAEKILQLIDKRELGRKLRNARRKRGMTQEQAAEAIGVGRTTMVAIEKGTRAVSPVELLRLSLAYGRDISKFIKEANREAEFASPQFRGPADCDAESDAEIEEWVDELKELSRSYFEVESLLKAPLVRRYPPEYQLGQLRAHESAESIALEERRRLGLGDGPIHALRDVLEQEVGLRIYCLPIKPSKYSAIYVYSDRIGACIAVNSQHPVERMRMSLAHDYGHFLTFREMPKVYSEEYGPRRSRREILAEQFAIHFLMPASGIFRHFASLQSGKGKVTPYDVVEMANYFGVSFQALLYRLESLKLIASGMHDYLRAKGFKVRDAQRHLSIARNTVSIPRLPLRHQLLAIEAYRKGMLGESELSVLFEVDRSRARELANVPREELFHQRRTED